MTQKTLLLADNNSIWLNAAHDALKINFPDLNIVKAPTYPEAAEKISGDDFDIIILDIMLMKDKQPNDISGLKLAKWYAINTPKIMVTSADTFENLREIIKLSNGVPAAVEFIPKLRDSDFILLCGAVETILKESPHNPRLFPSDLIFDKPDPEQGRDIFIVMPFAEKFDNVYKSFQNAAQSCGKTWLRGDEQFNSSILNDIWSAIIHSQLIIVECTGKNPNVFYELGLADSRGKSTILVTQEIDDIPFDIRTRRHISYKNTPNGLKKLENELVRHINALL